MASGATKPITSTPDVTLHPKGGLMVAFGSGRYLGTADLSSTERQTAYGIWDKTDTAVTLAQLQPQLIESTTVTTAARETFRFSTHRVGPATDKVLANDLVDATTRDDFFLNKRGWYLDLPSTGERVVADSAIRGGRAVFTSIIPATDVCSFGGTGWVLQVDAITGNRRDGVTFDTNNDGRVKADDLLAMVPASTELNNASGWAIGALPSAAAVLSFKTGSETTAVGIVNTSDAKVQGKAEAPSSGAQQRAMWRVVE